MTKPPSSKRGSRSSGTGRSGGVELNPETKSARQRANAPGPALGTEVQVQSEHTASAIKLSFYDHHRQTYGHMPIRRENAIAEFMLGDYGEPGEDHGVDKGGEFAIYLYDFSSGVSRKGLSIQMCIFDDATGSLRAFLDSGAWDTVRKADLRTRDDMTAALIDAGLYDRSHHPVGHRPVCHCCARPIDA